MTNIIQRRIKGIAKDDPKRGKKAFRVFLEAVLLSQFGDHLINDPQFQQMVEDVQAAMESDNDVKMMIDSAIDSLLA